MFCRTVAPNDAPQHLELDQSPPVPRRDVQITGIDLHRYVRMMVALTRGVFDTSTVEERHLNHGHGDDGDNVLFQALDPEGPHC